MSLLESYGILSSDIRLLNKENKLDCKAEFGNFIIPNWKDFKEDIIEIYNDIKKINDGENASYIPQLKSVNSDFFGVAICTVDGQILQLGDSNVYTSVQSCSKPITYCISVEENSTEEINGEDYVHNFVGREPSGRNFNELCMNHENIPHNPMINAGSIMCVSLINYEKSQSDRYDKIINYWSRLCANEKINFSNSVYLSEKNSADRNRCLGYIMQEKKAFQKGKSKLARQWSSNDLEKNLELYFQCCSIETTCVQIAKIYSVFANGGICPFTNERIFGQNNVKNALSLMYSCGMYDYSGEWAYLVGIPAKSGVSGILVAVVPNVLSVAIYSPKLDTIGNSVKGVEFLKRFEKIFNFHTFNSALESRVKNITKDHIYTHSFNKFLLFEASSKNDLETIKRLFAEKIDINIQDYDGRTALHIAASNNCYNVVKFLLDNRADIAIKDRYGNTASDDAEKENNTNIIKLLKLI
jgi:glutaminase